MCKLLVLGGGVTGLAAGMVSGAPIYEARAYPGGICSSYYLRPGDTQRLPTAPDDGEAYRFEIGGGHWIFGGDPLVLKFIDDTTPTSDYARISGVWFAEDKTYVPYPLQDHLRCLGPDVAARALQEMARANVGPCRTMKEWLYGCFGPTLCEKFFYPFHDLYTAGLYHRIAPQDAYKSPANLSAAIQGALLEPPAAGYNATFRYPAEGLNVLSRRMAERCDIHYGKEVQGIDIGRKEVHFTDGTVIGYEALLCTLPLNHTLRMAGLSSEAGLPYSSVLVLNVGGVPGPACPRDHWLYHPRTNSGFHRVGFYSNVDNAFIPRSARHSSGRVGFYIERAFEGGKRPSEDELTAYARSAVEELRDWRFLEHAEVVDPTWIDVAYTWADPGSPSPKEAIDALQEHDVFMVGRYARWTFQGIADSIRDGFCAGASLSRKRSSRGQTEAPNMHGPVADNRETIAIP